MPRAFTLLEMMAVIVVLGLLATGVAWQTADWRHGISLEQAAGELAWQDHLARTHARGSGQPVGLIIDPARSELHRELNGETRTVYRLPGSLEFSGVVHETDPQNFGRSRVTVRIAENGRGPGYAFGLTDRGKQSHAWFLVAGLSGQMTQVQDEETLQKIFEARAPSGRDAR